ncbi:S9 family peptidase [Clostridium hydrogeniformans]|uniref:S9 family peptidase n=1 Tax=Clostridium hydrogeniformans TaxID=349933 RepID=UPI00047FB707|nr:S9 family peptidase [Clostridium hydrogeniformans]
MNKTSYTSIDELVQMPWLQSISIGKEGKVIAYVKRTSDLSENVYRNHVWVYEVEDQKHYPITTGKFESSSPVWAPNKNYLAYIVEVGEKEKARKQIVLKTFDEFNGIQITNSKEGVNKFIWSPDGKGIYYTTREADSEDLKKRKETYGEFEYVDKEYKNDYLCYVGIEEAIESFKELSNKKKDDKEESKDIKDYITNPKDFSVRGFNLSPDGKKAALICTPTGDIRDEETNIYILDILAKNLKKLNIIGVVTSKVVFSPDGNKIAFAKTPREPGYYEWNVYEEIVLEIYDVEKEETIMRLSEFDRGVMPIKWTSRGILANWQDRASYKIGMVSEKGEVSPIYSNDECYIDDADSTPDGKNIAYIKSEKNKAAEVYINSERITNESRVYENKLLSKKELITWGTKDGLQIEGVLSKPYDYDSNKKYPLLVVIHGGPTWASFPIHNMNKVYPIDQFVERGFVVLEPNYRGSSGYGDKFLTSNFRMLGVGDYEDVISGVDFLVEKGVIDNERVGVMGWSQGGYISAFCTTFSNRFKAVSVGAGISNWTTYYVNTDITTFTRSYLGATPWDDPEIYAKTSPMTYIKTACTPTLIQHGENDKRVPVPNAYELYRGLQDLKVESELVIFKGMGHGPHKPGLHKAIMEQNLQWFVDHV